MNGLRIHGQAELPLQNTMLLKSITDARQSPSISIEIVIEKEKKVLKLIEAQKTLATCVLTVS